MSEVLIVLKLKRRSGVLAAAVAAVHRAGLEFQSQRMITEEDVTVLHLQATGGFESVDPVAETMGAVSGVSEVIDILVDGASRMHVPEEPETAIESVDEFEAGLVAENPWSELGDEAPPVAEEIAALSEPDAAPEPEAASLPRSEVQTSPEPRVAEEAPAPTKAQADLTQSSEQSASSGQAVAAQKDEDVENEKSEKSEKEAPKGPRMMTPAMRRRRRWR